MLAMTKQQAVRPAGLAIAAFLASVSPAVLAQTAAPAAPEVSAPVQITPPVLMNDAQAPVAPAASTPATPVFAPNQPVVQATPSVEERRAAAVAAAEAENAAPAESARPATVTPRAAAPRAAPVEVAAREEAPAVPAPAPVAPPPVSQAPVANTNAAPVAATSTPATAPAPVVATPANDGDTSLLWALGGGALLFLGIGASAMMRRRGGERDMLYPQDMREEVMARPIPAAAPVMAPVAPAAPNEPAMRAPTPPVSPQPSASYSSLEAMVAAPPSQENPFRTKAKRMRRARYVLAQREAQARAPEQSRAATPPQTIAAEDRSQTVYSFGKQGQRSGVLKPRNI